jgi:ATP-binding cassette subfamily B protein/subfamily B ATP-binding cassette protein MsbA
MTGMGTFWFIGRYARRYVFQLSLTVASMLLLVGAELVAPLIVREMLAAVQRGGFGPAALSTLARLAAAAAAVYGLRALLQFLRSYMAHVAGWRVVADVRQHIYRHLQRLSLRFYSDRQTGQLMSRLVNDSDMFERLIAHAVPDIAVNVLTLAGVSIVLGLLNPQLLLLSLLPIPLIVYAMRGFARHVRPAFRERQAHLGELNATLNDNLSGIREIQSFTREEIEAHRVGGHIRRYCDSMLRALRLMATFQPFVELASSLGVVLLIYFGGRLAWQRTLPLEDLVAFFLYLHLFYQPVRALGGAWEAFQEAVAGADRVSELLEEEPDVVEAPDAVELPAGAAGELRFENVTFAYARGGNVLENIDLRIRPRSVTALVGATGVGKTTLVSLIPRFYDAVQGSITIDGIDIRRLSLRSLRQRIAIVSQDVFLFHGTVRDNILFGRPEATSAEIEAAARIANAEEFILRLPQGYDTTIGERGVKLSGGQKQRLAIARAVLKDAPILILDEATSSVDTETELLIQQALDRLMADRTAIVIAHRLSTIRGADQIVVLQGSRIAQIGTHEELLAREGLYRHLSGIQAAAHAPAREASRSPA